MEAVKIGDVAVSRFILGSNPFSGFSHQTPETDREMERYFTVDRIKRTLRDAEALGINTLIGRGDRHIVRMLMEYWDEGGSLQWFAQTCPGIGDHEAGVRAAWQGGATACHVHGGVMDYLLAQGKLAEAPAVIDMIRDKGMLAGIAGHNPQVFTWAEEHLDVDYYMCSYYNSAHRDESAEHRTRMKEWFLEEDRRIMTELIERLSRPVIHYKVLAAGRNDPADAFATVARCMRPNDAVCVGVFTRDKPDMLHEDVALFEAAWGARSGAG